MKTILIAGATGEIGKSITRALAAEGNEIIAIGRQQNELEALCAETTSSGGLCSVYAIDVANHDAVHALAAHITTRDGIDWIINAVGWIHDKDTLAEETEETIMRAFQSNTLSVIYLAKFLLPLLKEKGGMISLSSAAGISGNGKMAVYSATKGAVNTFTQAIAHSIAEKDLSAIALCPGPTNTAMRQKKSGDAAKHQNPEIIADVVANIISGNSPYKNGDIVLIKNGIDTLHSGIS